MPFAASEYHWFYQLRRCSLRVYLRAKGMQPSEPDVYHKLLERLGQRHEQRHLKQFAEFLHAHGNIEDTRAAFARKERVIYQPAMRVNHPEYGEIVGVPDFFIREDDGYVIRDCKLPQRFSEDDHPEIFRQLELYGWLYEQTFGSQPKRLEAYMGDGQLQVVPYQIERALEVLSYIQDIKQLTEEPFEPIGWSKCLDCGYNAFCWARARERHAVALLPGVDQPLARTLHEQGIITYDDLLDRYTEATLADVTKGRGKRAGKVGGAAVKILNHARAFKSGEIIPLNGPAVKKAANLVMFDVEGIPPHLDHSEKTYLWGLKVFGEKPRSYSAALATAKPEGDREGWDKFLTECAAIFAEYDSIPFVHWSSYERNRLHKYIKKYGDNDEVAARVLENLYDLLPVVEGTFVIPTPSYGLKLIERFAGYTRTLTDAGGKWSMATYIEAVETEDPDQAARLMGEILKYNEEDLDAMWFVYQWIVGKSQESVRD